MTKLTQMAMRNPQHICIFGDPKSGKSSLAETVALLPEVRKVLWFSLDNGHEVLFKLPQEAQEKIELVVLPDTREFPVAFPTIKAILSGTERRICDSHGQIECSTCKKVAEAAWTTVNLGAEPLSTVVVFDHITQLANSCMHFIIKGKKDDFFPGWDEFRLQGLLMDGILGNIQQAPYHVICVAHSAETEMEDGTKKLVPLVGTVPYSRGVGKIFDHIIYCRVSNRKHTFGSRTTFINSVLSGSRSDVALEDTKEGTTVTLAAFFAGKIPTAKELDHEAATEILRSSTIQSEISYGVTENTTSNQEVPKDKDTASVVESFTATPESIAEVAAPVATEPTAAVEVTVSSSEKAKAILAALNSKKR